MIVDMGSDQKLELVTDSDISDEFTKKVEILLILMSFIFALLLVLLILSIIM